jgi:hypothetical protein
MITSVSAIMVNIYPYELNKGNNILRLVVLNHEKTIQDAKVAITIPDFDSRQHEILKLSKNKAVSTYMETDVPENAKGYYPVRVTISDKYGVQHKTHTWILVE